MSKTDNQAVAETAAAPAPQATPRAPAPQSAPAPKPVRTPGYGELIPRFIVASDRNPQFQSMSLGGKWMVLMFFGSLTAPLSRAAHDRVVARRALFDDIQAQLFGVCLDPADRTERGLKNSLPGLRYFWDFDFALTRGFGLFDGAEFLPRVFLLDPQLRVAAVAPLEQIDAVLDLLDAHLTAERAVPADFGAPVLTVPRILEPDTCRAMIDYYESVGGTSSGFMRETKGVTYPVLDDGTKRRRDVVMEEGELCDSLRRAISYRLAPLVRQAFCWSPSRIERYIVACYSAEDAGFFKTHRDNTTGGTAHRRFAVSINLNDDYDGGDLRFPEFGARTYRPPAGGATVFSCSLLHEATPVTRGLRYATLPFL
jgi:predicted 2-oxoglutarate/Fe(II)-dependent dioxygenase YbiX